MNVIRLFKAQLLKYHRARRNSLRNLQAKLIGFDCRIGISQYTISADCLTSLPDMHVQTLKGIHFLKPLLKGVVWQKTEFDFVAHVLRTKPLIVEKWFAPKLSV